MIGLNKMNPDWYAAEDHGKATKPGFPHRYNQSAKIERRICHCCLNEVEKQPVPLCQNSKELEFLGFGFPLYFIFMKFAMLYLLLLIISYSIFGVFEGYKHNLSFCNDGIQKHVKNVIEPVTCTSWMVAISRTEDTIADEELLLRVTSFVLQIVALIFIRDNLHKTNKYYDEKNVTIANFSVLVQNIPLQRDVMIKIKDFFNDSDIFIRSFQYQNILLIEDLRNYFDIHYKIEQCIKDLQKLSANKSKKQEDYCKIQEIQKEIAKLEKQMMFMEICETEKILRDEIICEKAIIILEKEEEKQIILRRFSELKDKELIYKHFGTEADSLTISQCPEPKQLIWENIYYSDRSKISRKILSWMMTILLLSVVTTGFYFLLKYKSSQIEHAIQDFAHNPDSQEGHSFEMLGEALVYIALIFILLFNKFILSTVLHKLTDMEKRKTNADYQFSFALKSLLGLFFTTALMTLLVEDFSLNNIYARRFGVIEEETIMLIMSASFVPLLWLINPDYIFHYLKRKYHHANKNFTQKEANQLMENPKYSIGKRYAEVIKMVWFAFLYASIIPIGGCFIFVGLIIFYWVDKYNLLRRSTVTDKVSGELSKYALKLLDMTLILKPTGQILFDYQLRQNWTYSSLTCLVVGFIYVLLPMNDILVFFHNEKFDLQEKSYSQIHHEFLDTYHTMYPLLNKEKVQHVNWLNHERQKKQIDNSFVFGPTVSSMMNLKHLKGFKDPLDEEQSKERPHITRILSQQLKKSVVQKIKQSLEENAK